jgi:hypothetical protein
VRFVQAGRGVRLAAEPLLKDRVLREMRRQHLQRDNTVGSGVVGAEHLPHAAFAQQIEQPVAPELFFLHPETAVTTAQTCWRTAVVGACSS